MAGASLFANCAGSTTERPRFIENQIRPVESATTELWRRTPSTLSRPSEVPNSRTSVSVARGRYRMPSVGAATAWFEVAIHSEPFESSASPRICSCRSAGTWEGI